MAVENWIDQITKLWEFDDGKGGTVRSYRLFEKGDFPEALTTFPCALTYPKTLKCDYSAGGPCLDFWDGVTEFHITPDLNKANFPYISRFYAKIRNAAAASMTLGGRVEYFILKPEENSIQGIMVMKYGAEAEHYGLQVNWRVKEDISSEVTVS